MHKQSNYIASLLSHKENSSESLIENLYSRIEELEDLLEESKRKRQEEIKRKVVILVHGIRDQALWQSQVRACLRNAGFTVFLTNYGRFDLFRFYVPFPLFRNSVIDDVYRQIRQVKKNNPHSEICVIAHSFGTFIISNIMEKEFDLVLDRVIFCGGVYSKKIQFEQFSNRFKPQIINEIGTKDFWPAVAESTTWVYGSPGTFGRRQPLFEDRWHKDYGHSDFLSEDFCSKYWVPFLKNGTIVQGELHPEKPCLLVRIIGAIHLKYIIICILLLLLLLIYA